MVKIELPVKIMVEIELSDLKDIPFVSFFTIYKKKRKEKK